MAAIKQAVILAGGLGTRLRPITDTIPKPMVEFHGKPFLHYLVEFLRDRGINEILMLLGYLPERITEYFGDGSSFGIRIHYSTTPVWYDTGGRLVAARDSLKERFVVLYGDNYCPVSFDALVDFHNSHGLLATVTAYAGGSASARNNLSVTPSGRVLTYDKSRQASGLNALDIGFFVFDKGVIDLIPDTNVSLERDVLPKLIAREELACFRTPHRYHSIGSPERLPVMERFLEPRKILFLDRDGVINKKAPKAEYIVSWERFEFLPGAISAMKELFERGYELYVVSNQAGIARGMMTEKDLAVIHERLAEALAGEGVELGGVYHCPHGWEDGCWCRKPNPGMFFRAAEEHIFDLTRATFIGDDPRDKEAGDLAGCKTIIVNSDRGIAQALANLD